ncbi:MAG: zinc transporter ZupT [Alphaproteobacteria bacterium]|nr:zinc transporter ZupT [Alphaproteobacteria bacterium]
MYSYSFHDVMVAFAVCVGAALATVIGSATIIRAKANNPKLLAFGLAFAAGAMVYVSLVEIFGKSVIAFSAIHGDVGGYKMATLAFFGGMLLLVGLDRLVPNPHGEISTADTPRGDSVLKRTGLLAALAITAHNIPEGMASFFATLDDPVVGAPLAIAIAVHNIPEGVSIAIPVYYATGSRKKALIAVGISAMAEPLGAAVGYGLLAPFLTQAVFGTVFGAIAGAMVFLSMDELLPAAKRYSSGHETAYGLVLGMATLALSLVLFK